MIEQRKHHIKLMIEQRNYHLKLMIEQHKHHFKTNDWATQTPLKN